jgi:hypothetical protein
MPRATVTRRSFLKEAALIAAPLVAAVHAPPLAAAATEAGRQLKILCIGAHPDDPESGCAGTLSRYVQLGHSATVLYLTRGERGIRDKGLGEAAKIRSAECEQACQVIGARPKFFGQIDGATENNPRPRRGDDESFSPKSSPTFCLPTGRSTPIWIIR